jgi:hypothetical protein
VRSCHVTSRDLDNFFSSSLLGGSLYEVEHRSITARTFLLIKLGSFGRMLIIVLTRADIPIDRPAQKNGNAVLAFYDELDRWISRPSPASDEDAKLNSEIVLQVLKDMSILVGNISELASQVGLWPELLPRPIEFYHPKSASRAAASAASVAKRATGGVLAFRTRKDAPHSYSVVFEADVKVLIDERERSPDPRSPIANESS